MSGLFRNANELVVLSAGRNIEWTAASVGSVPSGAGDGVALLGSTTAYVKANATATLVLYVYYADTTGAGAGWYKINGGELSSVDSIVERVNVAGADRFAVYASAGSPTVEIGRAIVE